MVDHITEKFRHHTLNEQFGLYRGTGRSDSLSPVVTTNYPTSLVRGRSAEEATHPNVFSIPQSQTPPSRGLDPPPLLRTCQFCERDNYPPNKRHCRSLSIPNGRGPCHHANLYRPVPVRPGSTKAKNRHSPLNYSKSHGSLYGVTSPGVHRSSSEFSSPPDSPIPRPASVSSGYYDSSMSSLAGIPWLEQQFSPNMFQKSLSMEESISGFQGVLPPFSPPAVGKHKIPRCRSQPCVLTKSGIKRRRDDLVPRPTVDFLKMKETAYHFRRPRAHSASCPKDIRSPRTMLLFDDDGKVFGLKPILGSPLDSHITTRLGLSDTNRHCHDETPKIGHVAVSPSTSPTQEEDEEVEGINFSKLCGEDSGCSADDDPPHLVEYASTFSNPEIVGYQERYPGINDYSPQQRQTEIFPLDGLDLEQIEND